MTIPMTPPGDGGPDLLKPCPCCGKDEAILCDATGDHFVHCAFCGLRTARFSTDECAVLHWNERPEPRPSTRDAALQTETDRWEKQARMMAIRIPRRVADANHADATRPTSKPDEGTSIPPERPQGGGVVGRPARRCVCFHGPEQHGQGGCGMCDCPAGPGREDHCGVEWQDGPIDFHQSQSDAAGPCEDCGADHGDRSPCPSCGKVFCRPCAESPYAFCCDGMPPAKVGQEMPKSRCPRCGREEDDFDGFGVLAHTKPAYVDGCGYCSHPSRDNGVCGICGDVRP